MITWLYLKQALDSILKPDEKIVSVHIASGYTRIEIVRYPEPKWTLVRSPTGFDPCAQIAEEQMHSADAKEKAE